MFLAIDRTSTRFVHFSKAIGVAHADPRETLPLLAIESSFFEVVGCLVSSVRDDGSCRVPLDQITKNVANAYRTKWNTPKLNV